MNKPTRGPACNGQRGQIWKQDWECGQTGREDRAGMLLKVKSALPLARLACVVAYDNHGIFNIDQIFLP